MTHNIVRDYTSSVRERLTCVPCDATIVHQPFMFPEVWEAITNKFKQTHPDATFNWNELPAQYHVEVKYSADRETWLTHCNCGWKDEFIEPGALIMEFGAHLNAHHKDGFKNE